MSEARDLARLNASPQGDRPGRLQAADLVRPEAVRRRVHPAAYAITVAIVAVRRAGLPLICLLDRRVILAGLGLVVSDLLRRGIITHLATDDVASAWDLQLAVPGETAASDSRPDGGEERWMHLHRAIRAGVRDGLGWGQALGRYLAEWPEAQRELTVAYSAYALGVPYTVHATIGEGTLWRDAACDPGALGWATGHDFRILEATVARLDGGAVLNVGPWRGGEAVLVSARAAAQGPRQPAGALRLLELPLGRRRDPRQPVLNLYGSLLTVLGDDELPGSPEPPANGTAEGPLANVSRRSAAAGDVLRSMAARHPELAGAAPDLARAYLAIAQSLAHGGTLFLCGNGGSFADALHISGELLKSYAHPRPLPEDHRARLSRERNGEALAASLERGLRAIVLGANAALASAVNNDFAARDLSLAQELYALARPGDVFLGISTSGKAANVGSAASVARALGMATLGLTGPAGGPLASQVDVAIRAPGSRTDRIQEQHVVLYHTLCEMLEVDLCAPA